MESLTNCVIPSTTAGTTCYNIVDNCWQYPAYYPTNTIYTFTYTNTIEQLSIRKVENGFIVTEKGKDWVFDNISKMNKFLEKRYA